MSSGGYDNIPMSVFKKNFDILGPSVTKICNQSLVEGIFPSQLKIAKVTPIFKAGSKGIMNNYRPISILPAFSKILEKTVYVQITEYFRFYNLLSPAQYGFRSGLSTENAINNFLDFVYRALDNGEFTSFILSDL